jgi:hypothetical protein
VGTAASIAARYQTSPRNVGREHLRELQQALMDDDCYLPWHRRDIPDLTRAAELTASHGDPEPLRNGVDRPVAGQGNDWAAPPAVSWVQYRFAQPRPVAEARMVLDSDLNRKGKGACAKHPEKNCLSNYPLDQPSRTVPASMTRAFRLESLDAQGHWQPLAEATDNYQRLVRVPVATVSQGIRLLPLATWGAPLARLFAFDMR